MAENQTPETPAQAQAPKRRTLVDLDRRLLETLRERMRYKEAHPAETTTAAQLLTREEQKDLSFSAAAPAFLRMTEALCEGFPAEDPYFHYPALVRRRIAESKNEFSRLSAFGCVLSDRRSMARMKKIQPACRVVGFTGAVSLFEALVHGEVQYAFLKLEDPGGADLAAYELLRRYRVFIVGTHVFEDRSRYGILSPRFAVYPEANRIAVSLRAPDDGVALSRLYSCFFSSDYKLLRANTFPAACRDRIGVQLEIGTHSYREEIYFILDLMDRLFDEMILEGVYYQKETGDL